MTTDPNDFTSPQLIETLIIEGHRLSKELATVKTLTSKEMVSEHEIKIDRFRNNLKSASNALSRKIDECRAYKRQLELMDDVLKTDKTETKNYFWELHQQEKEMPYRSLDQA